MHVDPETGIEFGCTICFGNIESFHWDRPLPLAAVVMADSCGPRCSLLIEKARDSFGILRGDRISAVVESWERDCDDCKEKMRTTHCVYCEWCAVFAGETCPVCDRVQPPDSAEMSSNEE